MLYRSKGGNPQAYTNVPVTLPRIIDMLSEIVMNDGLTGADLSEYYVGTVEKCAGEMRRKWSER
jgi:hypothetical protein